LGFGDVVWRGFAFVFNIKGFGYKRVNFAFAAIGEKDYGYRGA
jgi:hypothetical protein